jgi:hypothetical protein
MALEVYHCPRLRQEPARKIAYPNLTWWSRMKV